MTRLISSLFLLGLVLETPLVRADDLNIINNNHNNPRRNNSQNQGRGANAPNTGNSSRSRKDFGFFAEPSVGFGYGSFSGDTSGALKGGSSASLTGPSFSGLLGAVYTSYFAGLRLDYAMLSGGGLSSMKDFALGVLAGTTLGSAPIRFYGGFDFIDNLSNAGRTLSSDSFLIGGSYYISKKLVLNLEYHFRSYGSVNLTSTTSVTPSFNNALLTISLPLMFGISSMPEMARQNEPLKEVGGSMDEWNI